MYRNFRIIKSLEYWAKSNEIIAQNNSKQLSREMDHIKKIHNFKRNKFCRMC